MIILECYLRQWDYVFSSVCLMVGSYVCQQDCSKSYGCILMIFGVVGRLRQEATSVNVLSTWRYTVRAQAKQPRSEPVGEMIWWMTMLEVRLEHQNLQYTSCFLDPEGGSQNATLVVLVVLVVVVVISSLSKGTKMPKAFLIRSEAQRNFAYTFASDSLATLALYKFTYLLNLLTLPTDLPSQIFHLFSN